MADLIGGHAGNWSAREHAQVQTWFNVLIAAARSGPFVCSTLETFREDVVVKDNGEVGGVELSLKSVGIVDDIMRRIHPGAEAGRGKNDVVVRPVERGNFRLSATASLLRDVGDGIIEKRHATAAVAGAG